MHRKLSSKERIEAESRRVAIKVILMILVALLFGLLWRIFVGPIHRHERH